MAQTDNLIRHGRVTKRGASLDPNKRFLPDEPAQAVKFVNSIDPGTPVDFTLGVMVPDPENPGKERKEFERYSLLDQYVYRLPTRVIKHLMSLRLPIYENRQDPETLQIRSVQVGWQNRFSLIPADFLPPDKPGGAVEEGKKAGRKAQATKDPVLQKAQEGASGG